MIQAILSHSELLNRVKARTVLVLEKNQERLIYNNMGRMIRMEKYLDTIEQSDHISRGIFENTQIAMYLLAIIEAENDNVEIDFEKNEELIEESMEKLAQHIPFTEEQIARYKEILIESQPNNRNVSLESKLMSDIYMMDFTGPLGRNRIKMMYEEMILRGYKMPQKSWYASVIPILEGVKAETEYGKVHVQPKIDQLLKKLKKEYKSLEEKENRLLKKELNIGEIEIKQLKKEISKAKGRDDKGIQTLFRLTVKNHYTLNEMVDRKASIMITVNSIIISLVVGGVIGSAQGLMDLSMIPVVLLVITSVLSIVMAILSIRPNVTQGHFTENEIRQKKHNLLYFGNFHNMGFPDFEWAFLKLLEDRDYLYNAMIKDYYFLGVMLSKKYALLRHSLTIFLIGLSLSAIAFLGIQFAYPITP